MFDDLNSFISYIAAKGGVAELRDLFMKFWLFSAVIKLQILMLKTIVYTNVNGGMQWVNYI